MGPRVKPEGDGWKKPLLRLFRRNGDQLALGQFHLGHVVAGEGQPPGEADELATLERMIDQMERR